MATLNTLRTRGALFLSIVIGIALISFLIGDLTGLSSIFNNRRNRVGSIDGNHIDYMEYVSASDNMNRIIQMLYGRNSLSSEEMDQVRDMVWDSYIRKFAYDPGYRRLGLSVGEKEQVDMIRGNYISPVISSVFASRQTGMYDPSVVLDLISNMEHDTDGSMSAVWRHIKNEMSDERMYSKYMALVHGGVNVNDLEVGYGLAAANNVYDGRYVSIPYSQVPDSLAPVTSAEIRKYYSEHKNLFKQAAARDIEYVVFDLLPSDSDFAEAEAHINSIAQEFAEAEFPMQYASLNSQERTDPGFYSEEQLPVALAAIAFGERKGEMAGPTLNGNVYTVSRIAEERMMPDSIGARHILLPPERAASADSIVRAIKGGKSIFELAPIYSIDPNVDLGVFPPEVMIQSFSDAVIAARVGDVITVGTQYGTHVVEVTHKTPVVKKVQVATVTYHVEPSSVTQQEVYGKARDFLSAATGSKENFAAAVSDAGISMRVATISAGDRDVRGLNDSRELVRWSFNTKPGTVSPIFDIDGDYVVAVITGARESGFADIRDVSAEIASKLRREKKAALLAERFDGRTFEEAAALEGAITGDIEGLRFSAFYIPDLGIEPAVIGAVKGIPAGSLSQPITGEQGVFLVEVASVGQTDDATDASERVRLEATAQTSLMQRIVQALSEGVEIVDNRAKFF